MPSQRCFRSDASCACGVAAIHRSCVNVAFRLSPAVEARLLTATDMRNCLPGAGGGSGRAMARSFSAPSWCGIVGRRWPPKNTARTVVLCVPDGPVCSVSGQQKRPSPRWFSAPRSRPTKRLPRSRPATLDAAQGAGGDGRCGRVGPRRRPADHRAAAWEEADLQLLRPGFGGLDAFVLRCSSVPLNAERATEGSPRRSAQGLRLPEVRLVRLQPRRAGPCRFPARWQACGPQRR